MRIPLDRHSGDDESPEGYEATNWDGSTPEIVDGTIWIKVLDCYPDCGCGGCFTREVNYPIDGKRFHYIESFDNWWHKTGSAISPNDGHEDVSEFAQRVCEEAWKAAKTK